MADLKEMAQYLNDAMRQRIPYDFSPNSIRNVKHKGRNQHIRNVALTEVIPVGTTNYAFDIGNDYAEMNYPYYHILEDAQVIHKRGRGTKTSKGSQSSYSPMNRDYGAWSGTKRKKTYDASLPSGEVIGSFDTFSKSVYQEYRKNVRGKRTKIRESSHGLKGANGTVYVNIHYHYIEKALDEDSVVDNFAMWFGLKRQRTQIDLSEELKEVFGE